MRRKTPTPPIQPVIAKELLDKAREALDTDKLRQPEKCSVCGAECAPNSAEKLCWVCRRLKISAWRDAEVQMPAQE